MQLLPITTKVVSLNPADGEVYSIQNYVIKFVSDLQQVDGFSLGILVSPTKKINLHDITEILLKAVLKAITLTIHNY
jgi:hypothetical protein